MKLAILEDNEKIIFFNLLLTHGPLQKEFDVISFLFPLARHFFIRTSIQIIYLLIKQKTIRGNAYVE